MTDKTTRHSVLFSTSHLSKDLGRLSIRGGASTLGGQIIKFIIYLASTMILARVLSPQDFGLIAMVTAITGFLMVFRNLGLSQATIQRVEITHEQVSALFWVNVAIGALLMMMTFALAPVVAWFYQDSRLVPVTMVISTVFLFNGLTVQHEALLRRQMRLTTVVTRDIAAMVIGVVTALLCAWAGLGYWSLVWKEIATVIANMLGVWFACRWLPGLPVRGTGVRSMLAFGGWLTGFSLLNYFSRNLDHVLLGRFGGAQVLGIYTKAYSLLLLPMGQITGPMTAVAIPALSRLQNDPDRFRAYYLRAVKLIAYISMPAVVLMLVLSREMILLFLGDQWAEAIPIFMILGISAILQPVTATMGWVYVSLGRSRRMFAWGGWVAPLRVLSFVVGLPWGALGVATSYVVGDLLLTYPILAFSLKPSPVTPRQFFATIYRPFLMSAIMGLLVALLRMGLQEAGLTSVMIFGTCGIAGGLVFLALARLTRSVWRDVQDILETLKQALNKRSAARE